MLIILHLRSYTLAALNQADADFRLSIVAMPGPCHGAQLNPLNNRYVLYLKPDFQTRDP